MSTSTESLNRSTLIETLSELPTLGEVISWSMLENRGLKNSHSEVVKALQSNSLDESVARKILPSQAFSRACQRLKEGRVIDVLGESTDDILFQFSRKKLVDDTEEDGKELEYKKEVKVLLEKGTGKLLCKDPAVLEKAQKELDRCLEERTTGDISGILNRLFQTNSDLIPIGVGVYFVPKEHTPFTERVQGFLTFLNRKMIRLPIPEGTAVGDKSVQEVVENHLETAISEMEGAVNSFTTTTREATLSTMADKINSSRMRAEAYSCYLKDRSDYVLSRLEELDTLLVEKVEALEEERKVNPATPGGVGNNGEKILSVLSDVVPMMPNPIKDLLGWDRKAVRIGSDLKRLMKLGKVTKKPGGYVKV